MPITEAILSLYRRVLLFLPSMEIIEDHDQR